MQGYRGVWLLILVTLLPLLGGQERVRAAALPPYGQLVYQGSDNKLQLVNTEGGGRTLPTRGNASAPRWSPDGLEIVYYDELPSGPSEGQLAIIDPATNTSRIVVPAELRNPTLGTYWTYLQPRWSHDGGAIYYLLSGGTRTTTIMRTATTGGTPEEIYYGVNTTRFDISPTSGQIAITEDAFPEEKTQGSRLMLLDPDGLNERTVLPRSGAYYYQPTWTPDGRWIAVRRQSGPNSASSSLMLVNPANGEERTIGTLPGGSAYTFSPDGAWFAYAAPDTARVTLVNLADTADQHMLASGVAPAWRPPATRLFPDTGRSVEGRFLDYWEDHGGLAINGFPLTEARDEVLEDGRTYRVQWFERIRLEYHPENPAPYRVLLGQFGRRIHGGADPAVSAQPGARYFGETGHNVSGGFLTYWEDNGGLAQFGFPLTEVLIETLGDMHEYEVQYFERARFEYHPDNPEPYRILLGQFGRHILAETTP